jgi:hypothetical protein
MGLLAKIKLNKGSLIEQISGVKAVNTNALFKFTELDMSLYFNTIADLDGFGAFNGVKTIVFIINPSANTKLFLDNNSDKLEITGGNYSGTGLTENTVFTNIDTNTDAASFNEWQLVVSEFSAGINFATDLEIDPTANLYLGGDILLYDALLSGDEKNELYKYFQYLKNIDNVLESVKNIVYHKPSDLSNKNGLIFYFNGKLNSGDVVVDGSGSSGNGANNGTLQTPEGVSFDGVDDYILLSDTLRLLLSEALDFSIVIRFIARNITGTLVSNGINSSNRMTFDLAGGNGITATMYDGSNHAKNFGSAVTLNKPINAVMTWNSATSTMNLYVEGVAAAGTTNSGVDATTNCVLGIRANLSSSPFNGKITEVLIYNRILSSQEAIDYNNKYASMVVIRESFNNNGADEIVKIPLGWIPGTGSFKIAELNSADSVLKDLKVGTKYQECTVAGTIAMPSTWNGGTLYFKLYKGGGGNNTIFHFMHSAVDGSGNGYAIKLGSTERIVISRITNGAEASSFMFTATDYIAIDTFYDFKLLVNNGSFTIYIKGGSFGDVWTLVDVSGGAGSNPGTDTTYSSSKYMVKDYDALDRLTDILALEGIEQ